MNESFKMPALKEQERAFAVKRFKGDDPRVLVRVARVVV